MVCNRCIAAVKAVLEKQELDILSIGLGEVEISGTQLDPARKNGLADELLSTGFELIDDRRSRIIEKIKNVVINHIHHSESSLKYKYSEVISGELHYDYPYLSNLFSEVEGITIEQYIIRQKTEKIKEYIVYDELSLSEIADKMGYSSVAHLSSQFKKVTGFTPGYFKKTGAANRKPLDEVS